MSEMESGSWLERLLLEWGKSRSKLDDDDDELNITYCMTTIL